ncbi:pseudouridine synthase [Marinobacter sp. CHS3-4]|uniref:pseudouridine synthase n=1 Tax=Marinobacter sp. CHS3-4 TaxID=3045174 RepID=UPI0024B56774|nr:pseudouridine synthase [Marinobacter sp. CHS3-4]MDI9244083.1 pseudouridine synthase [Marinobacter sp. CHS3-4]
MRLDFFIANATELSRKESKRAIGQGRVQLEGECCRQPATKVRSTANVSLDGQALSLAGERYLMLNKPPGVISATADSQQPTVLDLLPPEERHGLHIVGRLDKDTTGLLLLTTDGQWSHRITAPRSNCGKTYRATLAEPLSDRDIQELEAGVMLKDEPEPTLPATVRTVGEMTIELTLSEGRYHQVKRMLAAVGNRVISLHRIRIGDIALDGSLSPGEYRELTADEVASVQ